MLRITNLVLARGTKRLLDGSSGVSANSVAGSLVSRIYVGGQFAGAAVTSNTSVVATLTQAATQASVTGVAATLGQTVAAGSFFQTWTFR